MAKSKKRAFYVYALLDPRKRTDNRYSYWHLGFEPFYVGKGKGNRTRKHVTKCHAKNTPKDAKIRKLLRLGYSIPVVFLRQDLTESSAFQLETYLIHKIGRRKYGGPLTNLTDGGEGTSGHIKSKLARRKISRALLKHFSHPESRELARRLTTERYANGSVPLPIGEANPRALFSRNVVVASRRSFAKGENARSIARRLSCTYKTAYNMLVGRTYYNIKSGLACLPEPRVGRPSNLTESLKKRVLLLAKRGESGRSIFRHTGIQYKTVLRYLRETGVCPNR